MILLHYNKIIPSNKIKNNDKYKRNKSNKKAIYFKTQTNRPKLKALNNFEKKKSI